MDNFTLAVAKNLAFLRKEKNYSLDDLSDLTGVSKSMLRQIEKGESSPTISTLWKIANGLKISFTSLIKEDQPTVVILNNKNKLPITSDSPGYRLYPLFPIEHEKGFEFYYIEIDKNVAFKAEGHQGNVEEYIFVNTGSLSLTVGEVDYLIKKEQSIRFIATGPHQYSNHSEEMVRAIMMLYYS
jgi:XRE family transcriptional regulator, regulator of sulfur utilization